jgi:monoamine oxidase
MRVWSVGIVGGGPGGLMTAYALQKFADCPMRVTIFEASGRLGGKILTPHFSNAAVRYEAGAAEFYDYSAFDDDPLKQLIAELGLTIRPMGGPAVIMDHRILSNLDDIRDHLGPVAHRTLVDFDRRAKDCMSPREFYHSDDPEGASAAVERGGLATMLAELAHPETRRYITSLIHSDLAAEPSQTSLGYGLQNYLMNDPAYMQLYGVEGGNERLPRELASRIDAEVLLNHAVTRVGKIAFEDAGRSAALSAKGFASHNGTKGFASHTKDNVQPLGDRLQITSMQDGVERCDAFDFVVIALPHNRLKSIEYQGERLAAALARHHAWYDYPAHYLRITILFEQPFWRDAFNDSYWMLDCFGGCCLYDESSRDPHSTHGVLGWLLGGDAAREMASMSDAELIAAALDSLPEFLAHGRHDFLEGRVHRWVAAVNAMPGGAAPKNLDRRHQIEPIEHENLFVVGDYLFDSTLNGVLDSAEYVAAWLAAKMADNAEDER